jgi:predicted O-linked N-acetylglucosamine transferase (SPINDLY family)
MIIKFPGGADVQVQETYYQRFATQGVSRQRIDIVGQLPFEAHMDLFKQVDMLLDTYPYNGGITTLEGLWMGVPTLTWTGQTFVSRAGMSILKRLDLDIFVAHSAEEYVQKALAFVTQIDELAQIRCALRSMMLHSSLCDLTRISQELEDAYRRMWHSWCETQVT